MAITLRLYLSALVFFGLAASPLALAPDNTCSWTGNDPGSNSWFAGQNWSCGSAPSADSDVIIGGHPKPPYLDGNVTIKSLQISGELDVSGNTRLFITQGWTAMDGAIFHGAGSPDGVVTGVGTVAPPGVVKASITFDGTLTILPLATLKPEAAPCGWLTSLADVINQGVIGVADDAAGLFEMKGLNFQNYGRVTTPMVLFNRGGYQYVMGTGEWANSVDLRIEDGTKLKPTSAVTFKTKAFTIGGSEAGDWLDLSGAAVTFDGSDGAVRVNNVGSILGDYAVNTRSSVSIGQNYGSQFNVPLHVLTGITSANGTFNRLIEVEAGATLRVAGAPAGQIIAMFPVINRGVIDGHEEGCMFDMLGERFTNHGAVHVGNFRFQKTLGAQYLAGTGTWGEKVHLQVDSDVSLVLENSITMNVAAFTVHGVGAQPAKNHLDIGSYTLTLAGPSTFHVNSDGRVAGSGAIYTRGPLTMNTAGAALFQPTLQIQALDGGGPVENTTTLYGRYDGPVQVREDAILRLNDDSQVFINNDLTVAGDLSAGGGSLLTLSGEKIQIDGNFMSNGWMAFHGLAAQSVTGAGAMNIVHGEIDNPQGIDLSVPLSVLGNLALNGDIRATGPGVFLYALSTTTGDGDVWGTVTCPDPVLWDQPYILGNQDVRITLTALPGAALPPASLSVTLTRGAPGGLTSGLRWYRVSATGGANWAATLRLRYTQAEGGLPAIQDTLKLFRRPTPSGMWAAVAEGTHSTGGYWFEVSGLTSFSDWAIAAGRVFLPFLVQ